MMANAAALLPARATLDREGRLVAADPRLLDLNNRAGGTIGQMLAVPQLGTIARLARRLGIGVSRNVVVADGGDDLDLWVRAEPTLVDAGADGVALTVSGWRQRPSWQPAGTAEGTAGDFLRSAADWMWETDSTLALTFLAASDSMPGSVDTALLGLPLTRIFLLGEDDAGTFPILTGLAQRRPFEDQRATLRATGQPVLLSAAPRIDSAGAFVGFIGAAHAIGSSVPGAAKPTEPPTPDLDAVATAFAARLDQTLRAPLDRIIANADSIHAQSDGPLKQDYAEYAADIASAGRHLMGLVDDLVDLQAIERPDFSVAREPIDLTDVARRAAGLLQIRATVARVRIDKPAFGEILPATGEFRRALQVLVNLIANAVRYSPIDGMVWIRAERAGQFAAIIVADQGKGIALADQMRIFGKFERVDQNEAGGSGLGLYIARRLARAMGGDVTVDSAPGQGARFIFSLPLRG
ncbi:sensor histidine kinase [Sphingomonas sp. PAMC 26621]|uniref:sensor histidine kinase n=1 Tax=Sphingomonas sp. PAMC 26621 TaxID=1112213 RepID=UPI0002894461|nr:HAMP domain-containing sensor histidine kinase [Sphingomonas sp. PAMC 26621]